MRIERHLTPGSLDSAANAIRPETFRLPKAGQRDPYFNLSRSTYYELEAAGAIQFIRLRKRGNTRGITLIPFDQVLAYLRSLASRRKEE